MDKEVFVIYATPSDSWTEDSFPVAGFDATQAKIYQIEKWGYSFIRVQHPDGHIEKVGEW